MLIKVSESFYVEAAQISSLELFSDETAIIRLNNSDQLTISATAARYILILTEANESLIAEDELAAQPAPSLTSRVAVILRDQFVGGATQDQIGAVLNLSLEETANELSEALAVLIAETIVIAIVQDEGAPIYCHATHAPLTASPDPSNAIEAPASVPAEYSERSEVPKSDG